MIVHRDKDFEVIRMCLKKGKQVTFKYTDVKGEDKPRVGFVHELSDKHVMLLDTLADGYRKCLFSGIASGSVEPLNP